MEDAGTKVASPIIIPQPHAGIFYNVHPMAKKRGPPFNPVNFVHQNPSDNWNPMSWDWDSTRFVAKQLQSDGILVGSDPCIQQDLPRSMDVHNSAQNAKNPDCIGEDDENLMLKLGAGDGVGPSGNSGATNVVEPQSVSRPNKRVRAGSPGGANYPRCQVDNCKEDLSTAKDYHRRHKVCEVHSKASKALVGKQMQRFCQQCSRFHPLSEFDEGKRSCRRRLAGHNRRRRKTQPDDTTQRLLVPDNRNNNVNCDLDIVSLLAVLARAQGNNEDRIGKFSPVPNKDQLIQILSKINSLPLPADVAMKLPVAKSSNASVHNLSSSENQNQVMENASSPSTLDLLAVLSATSGTPSSDAFEIQSQPSTEESGSEKSKSPCVDQAARANLRRGPILEVSTMGERSGTSYHYPLEDVDCHVQETPSLPSQLFSSSPEDASGRKLQSGGKNCFSSGSSNPSEGRSPMPSPPIVHDLFPVHTSTETMKHDSLPSGRGNMKASMSNDCNTSLQLFGFSVRTNENGSIPSSPYHAGYSSSSGSDRSPSRLLSDVQDRTGRIVFKLFDKDPSHLPGSLRSQIFNWLSTSPSEMESYIRPGCIVLSIYLSMPSFDWEQFEKNLLQYVKSLVRGVDVDFWGNGRFFIHTDRQLASHIDGSIRLCKSWRGWSTPELIWVSPVAVVGGQETSLLLRGRRLTAPGTKIYYTHPSGYNISLVPALSHQDSATDELILGSLKVNLATPNTLGRCFIEVENNIRGTSFPVIIADDTICQELRLLEPDIVGSAEVHDNVNHIRNRDRHMSREEALHFLNELGWLFQRKHNSTFLMSPEYKLYRLQFLLIFSVECDFCALVETLLGILVEFNLGRENLTRESLEMLAESHLLNKAVKRRCRRMVDLLIRYSVFDSTNSSEMFIFLPNMAGPGGVTPLHLAACTSSADDIVDALTSDPKEIGLHCWNSLLDSNGLSPYAYALMRNNNSYNSLVARKYAKRMGQVSVSIDNEIVPFHLEVNKDKTIVSNLNQGERSCSRCALVAGYGKRFPKSQGLLQPPFIHSLLVVAAVCVCVCVFLRVLPYLSSVAPFAWENLDYGAM